MTSLPDVAGEARGPLNGSNKLEAQLTEPTELNQFATIMTDGLEAIPAENIAHNKQGNYGVIRNGNTEYVVGEWEMYVNDRPTAISQKRISLMKIEGTDRPSDERQFHILDYNVTTGTLTAFYADGASSEFKPLEGEELVEELHDCEKGFSNAAAAEKQNIVSRTRIGSEVTKLVVILASAYSALTSDR